MKNHLESFVEWTKLKIRLHEADTKEVYFDEREIWWASLGVNIGYEQDGKNKNFERPVLIIKKFNADTMWIVPLSSKSKPDRLHYYAFESDGNTYTALLSQLRLISRNRLLRKIRTFPMNDFEKLKKRLKNLL